MLDPSRKEADDNALASASPYNAKANKKIIDEVEKHDWTKTPVQFGEVCLSISDPNDFVDVWDAVIPDQKFRSFQRVCLYSFQGKQHAKRLPVGDAAISMTILVKGAEVPKAPPLFYLSLPEKRSADKKPALEHPTGFRFITNDRGSKNKRDISYWEPIAPNGYRSLGICFNRREPDREKYWCVREDLCIATDKERIWHERGWDGNGSLYVPQVAPNIWETIPDGQLVISPLAYFHDDVTPFLLRLPLALLDIKSFDFPGPKKPEEDPSIVVNHNLPAGLSPVIVVPYTAIAADKKNLKNQPYESPFYFVAAQPYYRCFNVFSPTGGGQQTLTYRVGVTKEDSETFEKSTSITTGIDVGAYLDGPAGSASFSMTSTFSLTKHRSKTDETVLEFTETLEFPETARVWQWQLFTDIVVTRSNGTQLRPIAYMNQDRVNIPPPVKNEPDDGS